MGVFSRIRRETNRWDSSASDAWSDWGRNAALYTGAVAAGVAAGVATANPMVGVTVGGALATPITQRVQEQAAARQVARVEGSLMRAHRRALALQPKAIDPIQVAERRRQRLASAFSRSDTILTGPLGLTGGNMAGGGRTLIGG